MDKKDWTDLDITRDEMKTLTDALKKEEFRKLLTDYCEEVNDPENKKLFQEELTQLEAERGIDVTFINPEPGYVIKTCINGKTKSFINVCKCDKVEKPISSCGTNSSGQKGLNWSIPYAQAPPSRAFDKKGILCNVYDVVFHPDTLHLAQRNSRFLKLVTDTACDAVQSAYSVEVDKVNLKFPKMTYKGTPQATIIRKKSASPPVFVEPSPLDSIYPPLSSSLNGDEKPQVLKSQNDKVDNYAKPKYEIIHSRDVKYHEFTHERDAKINLTIPKDLIVNIELPLLNSTKDVTLDVTSKQIYLMSEKPAKYKLTIDLAYQVNEKEGTAKFDNTKRQLSIKLPVVREKQLGLIDINKSSKLEQPAIVVAPVDTTEHQLENANSPIEEAPCPSDVEKQHDAFLAADVSYNCPSFTCNSLDNIIAYTLNVKNVDPSSIEVIRNDNENAIHLKFTSIGSGFFPVHYAFLVRLSDENNIIDNVTAEAWDNNVILQIELFNNHDFCGDYLAGPNADNLKEYNLKPIITASASASGNGEERREDNLQVHITASEDEIEIKIVNNDGKKIEENDEGEHPNQEEHHQNAEKVKRNKKKNPKIRSLSESFCDDLKVAFSGSDLKSNSKKLQDPTTDNYKNPRVLYKSRSMSESSGDDQVKSILKRFSSYTSSFSDSMEFGVNSLYGVLKEHDSEEQGLSESGKKSVRFSDVIEKQIFRTDASILGRKMKKMKQRAKKRAQDNRRLSESENSECEEKEKQPTRRNKQPKPNSSPSHDSGVDSN